MSGWFFPSVEEFLNPVEMVQVNVKPCPFCGRNDGLVITKKEHFEKMVAKNGNSMVSIECKNCDLEFKDYDQENSNDYDFVRMRLVKRWNDRKETDYESKEN